GEIHTAASPSAAPPDATHKPLVQRSPSTNGRPVIRVTPNRSGRPASAVQVRPSSVERHTKSDTPPPAVLEPTARRVDLCEATALSCPVVRGWVAGVQCNPSTERHSSAVEPLPAGLTPAAIKVS